MQNETFNNSDYSKLSNAELIEKMNQILASPYQNWLSTWGKNRTFDALRNELLKRGYSGEIPIWNYQR
ncbi:MAG: hypothetical protein LAT53_10155 [Idiomarina sp.]|nr:hypothetical protein [Idiomarina sp.]